MKMEEEKVRRINSWFSNRPAGPVQLRMFPTFSCNLACKFCPQGMRKYDFSNLNELPLKEWFRIIEEAQKLGCIQVDIGGGEPFFRKDTIAIMKRIKDLGMLGCVTTNGTLLSKSDIRKIVEMGWELVQVSIDSPKKAVHDYLRGKKGTFDKAVRTLQLFKYYKKKLGKRKPEIRLAMLLTNKNYDDVSQLISIAMKYDCNEFRITPMVVLFSSANEYQLDKNEVKELKECIISAQKNHLNTIKTNLQEIYTNDFLVTDARKYETIVSDKGTKNMPVCFDPWLILRIDPEGWVSCCSSNSDKMINVRGKRLKKIWLCDLFENMRKKIIAKEAIDACKYCCYAIYSDNLQLIEQLKTLKCTRKSG